MAVGHPEMVVEINDSELIKEAEGFLRYVFDHATKCGARVLPRETMRYGYWITKFEHVGDDVLETWEYNSTATEFISGASLTLRFWKDQHALCNRFGADFEPPALDQLSVVSQGVFEGLPVQGVRYSSPDHMSGWWITTDQYDGNINSLKHEHTYHVTAVRPDLAKYLALPPGFRFDTSQGEDVWSDEQVDQ